MQPIRRFGMLVVGVFTGLFLWSACTPRAVDVELPVLRVGHVGHDHHSALFVALDHAEAYEGLTGLSLDVIRDRERYLLRRHGEPLGLFEVIKVGGGSLMPKALSEGQLDVGLGGVAAVLAAYDKGAPVRLVSPLHSRGDMFVLRPDFPASTFDEFVAYAREHEGEPIVIGYKNPNAVAKIIFEEALQHSGVTFGGGGARDVQVQMIDCKGEGRMNVSLAAGIIDGYVCNNPHPAIGARRGILKIVADLEDLPPGTFRDHPCCCVGAHVDALQRDDGLVVALFELMLHATDTINQEPERAAAIVSRWIGIDEDVALESMATSGYAMMPSAHWQGRMEPWVDAMNRLGVLGERLKGKTVDEVLQEACDFAVLNEAMETWRAAVDKKP